MDNIEYIKTSELDLAATYLAMGFSIDGIYPREGTRRMDFYIKKTTEAQEIWKKYWARELRVEPLLLFTSRKEILTRMKEELHEPMSKEPYQE